MADHHEPKMGTKTKQKESILTFRMRIIIELRCIFIIENGLRFIKRYAVFSEVLFSFYGLPIKSNFRHIYIVFTFKN